MDSGKHEQVHRTKEIVLSEKRIENKEENLEGNYLSSLIEIE